jgi:glycogen synthase
MQILSVHNKYQIRGGEDESRESEEKLLREMGHQVDVYEEDNQQASSLNPLNLALRTIWSQQAHNIIKQKLARAKIFSWKKTAEEIAQVYEKVLEKEKKNLLVN